MPSAKVAGIARKAGSKVIAAGKMNDAVIRSKLGDIEPR
jgi:hypothetical protein